MKKIFTILLVFLTLTSCLGTKSVTDNNTSFRESVEVTDLMDSKIETSEAIKDEITINVPESSNPEVTRELIGLIKRMETSKTSGGNGYKFYYDEKLKALKLEIEIAKTQNTDVAKVKETTTESTFEESLDKYVRKFVIPWWLYIVGLFFIRKEIFWILKQIFPALRAFSIFKPRNPKTDLSKYRDYGVQWRKETEASKQLERKTEAEYRKYVEESVAKQNEAKARHEFEAKQAKKIYDLEKEIAYQKHVESKRENFEANTDFIIEQSKNMGLINDMIKTKGFLSLEEKRRVEDILKGSGISTDNDIKEE